MSPGLAGAVSWFGSMASLRPLLHLIWIGTDRVNPLLLDNRGARARLRCWFRGERLLNDDVDPGLRPSPHHITLGCPWP
jgi:hypothetical protein